MGATAAQARGGYSGHTEIPSWQRVVKAVRPSPFTMGTVRAGTRIPRRQITTFPRKDANLMGM